MDTVENAGLTLVEPVDNFTSRVVPPVALCYHLPLAKALRISTRLVLKRPAYGPESAVRAGLFRSVFLAMEFGVVKTRYAWSYVGPAYPQVPQTNASLSTTG